MGRGSGKRPCGICGRWFRPDRRQGERQRTCGEENCQRERHRRNCDSWNGRNREGVIEDRLRTRLRVRGPQRRGKNGADNRLNRAEAIAVAGLGCVVVMEEVAREVSVTA